MNIWRQIFSWEVQDPKRLPKIGDRVQIISDDESTREWHPYETGQRLVLPKGAVGTVVDFPYTNNRAVSVLWDDYPGSDLFIHTTDVEVL